MERELLLLGLLRHHNMHGYQLHEFINRNLASCTDMKKPTAYNLLEKMAEQGWLAVHESEDSESNRPPRRVYALTASGEAAFQRLLRENLSAFYPATFSGSIGLAFIDALPRAEALSLLRQRREMMNASLEAIDSAPAHEGSLNLVIDHQKHHLRSEVDWLDRLIVQLSKYLPDQ